jgi:Rrf2 family transcriptional regulator, nitric oxide-sensitive transcriptional repressor
MKVVHELGRAGYVATQRGRGGGLSLAREPASIRIGELLRQTEESWALVECLGEAPTGTRCAIEPACTLKKVFTEALEAFFQVLDSYTLADLVRGRTAPLRRLLRLL